MPRLSRTTAVSLALAALAALAALSVAVPAQELSPTHQRRVDSVFAQMNRTDAPGCVVGVSQQGRPVYVRGYGMSDLQHQIALGPSSIFHAASISKQFAAFSVALLAEEGKLSLEDDVRMHVPEVPDHGAKLTVRQLIHHTSGLRDQWSLLAYAGWRSDDLATERDILDLVSRQRGLNFRPGDEYLYSNTGYTLLAMIVQRVSGRSLRQFADERIFQPLGMVNTHFHDDHTMIVPGRTSAYRPGSGGGWRISIPVFDTHGATSLFTTAEDLLRWMGHLDAPTIGSPALWSAATTSARLNDGTPTNYGYGLSIGRWRGQDVIGHGGADAGYRAQAERFRAHGLGIAVLCNYSTANTAALSRRVAEALLREKVPAAPVAVRAPAHRASGEALARWVGVYRDTVSHNVVRLRVSGDSLFWGGLHVTLGSDTTGTPGTGPEWVALRPGADGRTTIVVEPRGLRHVVYVRQEPAVATAQLGAYAGTYQSDELDVRYEIVVRDTALVRRHRKMTEATLVPAGRDTFTYGGTTVIFTRDRRGRVMGFTVNDARVRGLWFARVP